MSFAEAAVCAHCGHRFTPDFANLTGAPSLQPATLDASEPPIDPNPYIAWSVICSLISVLFFPPFLGFASAMCAWKVRKAGKQDVAVTLGAAAMICMIFGI